MKVKSVKDRNSMMDGIRRGRGHAWTTEECHQLRAAVLAAPAKNVDWAAIAVRMGERSAKQCREKWRNDLRPDISKAEWTPQEEYILVMMHDRYGNKWTDISAYLPRRSENHIKNHWYSTSRAKSGAKTQTLLWIYSDLLSRQTTEPGNTGHQMLQKTVDRYCALHGPAVTQVVQVPEDFFQLEYQSAIASGSISGQDVARDSGSTRRARRGGVSGRTASRKRTAEVDDDGSDEDDEQSGGAGGTDSDEAAGSGALRCPSVSREGSAPPQLQRANSLGTHAPSATSRWADAPDVASGAAPGLPRAPRSAAVEGPPARRLSLQQQQRQGSGSGDYGFLHLTRRPASCGGGAPGAEYAGVPQGLLYEPSCHQRPLEQQQQQPFQASHDATEGQAPGGSRRVVPPNPFARQAASLPSGSFQQQQQQLATDSHQQQQMQFHDPYQRQGMTQDPFGNQTASQDAHAPRQPSVHEPYAHDQLLTQGLFSSQPLSQAQPYSSSQSMCQDDCSQQPQSAGKVGEPAVRISATPRISGDGDGSCRLFVRMPSFNPGDVKQQPQQHLMKPPRPHSASDCRPHGAGPFFDVIKQQQQQALPHGLLKGRHSLPSSAGGCPRPPPPASQSAAEATMMAVVMQNQHMQQRRASGDLDAAHSGAEHRAAGAPDNYASMLDDTWQDSLAAVATEDNGHGDPFFMIKDLPMEDEPRPVACTAPARAWGLHPASSAQLDIAWQESLANVAAGGFKQDMSMMWANDLDNDDQLDELISELGVGEYDAADEPFGLMTAPRAAQRTAAPTPNSARPLHLKFSGVPKKLAMFTDSPFYDVSMDNIVAPAPAQAAQIHSTFAPPGY